MYIFELFAAAATLFARGEKLRSRKIVVFVDIDAACVGLTKGASRAESASILVYYVRALVAKNDIPFRVVTSGPPR